MKPTDCPTLETDITMIANNKKRPTPQTLPDDGRLVGYCGREMLSTLIHHDHHTVRVDGRTGVLLTFHLMLQVASDRNLVVVVFDQVEGHPVAPMLVQQAVDRIDWLAPKNDNERSGRTNV